jgi:methyl-accepting chemotaxis protein
MGIQMSIKVRILGILCVLSIGYAVLLVAVQVTGSTTHRYMSQVSNSLFPAALRLRDAQSSYQQFSRRYKDAVLLEDSAALTAADKDGDTVVAALIALRGDLSTSTELAGRVDDIQGQFANLRLRSADTYGAMVVSRGTPNESLRDQARVLVHDDAEFQAALAGLDRSIAGDFIGQVAEIDAWSVRSRLLGWFMLLVASASLFGGWYVFHYNVVVPLQLLARRMQDIAEGDGDLTARLEVRGNDELDEVGRWFNVFIDRIETIVARVTENAHALAGASGSLNDIAIEARQRTGLQQREAVRIAESMRDISAAVHGISASTQTAAADARTAAQNAHSGGETIQTTLAAIQELLAENQITAAKVEALGTASDAIGRVIHVIDDIANQTNLLALNASIESARAGEHGRGFAVVAVEIRLLAERTSRATREIDETVNAIQGGTAEVVGAMRASMRRAESGAESARSAGAALDRIIEGSEGLQRMVTQIAQASTEQSNAGRSVDDNLAAITGLGETTVRAAGRQAEECDRLFGLATNLNGLVGAFKVRPARRAA